MPDPEPQIAPKGGGCLLAFLAILLTVVELILLGADYGFWGQERWRNTAYFNGAFWPGLLGHWGPNYPGQPALMFVTYGLLHSGLWHLLFNLMCLISLGRALMEDLGPGRFMAIYSFSQCAGALAYILLSNSTTPMVGASGALFGLAGAVVVRTWRDNPRLKVVVRPVAILVGVNIFMFVALGGLLAWHAHLGGFLAGAALMSLFTRPKSGRA